MPPPKIDDPPTSTNSVSIDVVISDDESMPISKNVKLSIKRTINAAPVPVAENERVSLSYICDDESPIKKARSAIVDEEENGNGIDRASSSQDPDVPPFLSLPTTVLHKLMRFVNRDGRLALSQTCQRLRNLLVYDESLPLMDRRRTVKKCVVRFQERFWISFRFHGGKKVCKELNSQQDYQEYMGMMSTRIFMENVYLPHLSWNPPVELSKLVEPIAEFSGSIHVQLNSNCRGQIAEFVDVFCVYPQLKLITFIGLHEDRWIESCTTVTQWAAAKGTVVERTADRKNWSFRREMVNGRVVVVIKNNGFVPS